MVCFHKYVDHELSSISGGMKVNAANYIRDTEKRFGVTNTRPKDLPLNPGTQFNRPEDIQMGNKRKFQSMEGALQFRTTIGRPYVPYCVKFLSRQNQNPTHHHLEMTKRVLVYLKTTRNLGTLIVPNKRIELSSTLTRTEQPKNMIVNPSLANLWSLMGTQALMNRKNKKQTSPKFKIIVY